VASRSLDDLVPELRIKAIAFKSACDRLGIPIIFTCTARTLLEQICLYLQGRADINIVNQIRNRVGIGVASSNAKVTWTLNSKHIVTNFGDKAHAFDIAIVKNGVAVWDIKVDVNNDMKPDYTQLGVLGESLGLTWGGRFPTSPDFPHYQI
jgi:peptidoglycan L-alanyl-D-glutamate endopeptidase CwlK